MNYTDFCKYYTQMLEPEKLKTISMKNESSNALNHHYNSSNTSTANLTGLKTEIKKI